MGDDELLDLGRVDALVAGRDPGLRDILGPAEDC
jgi:hypothetical protein